MKKKKQTLEEFNTQYLEFIKFLDCAHSYTIAYELAERKHIKEYGMRRYASWDSFTAVLRKKQKQRF